jgi:hypothetical protein
VGVAIGTVFGLKARSAWADAKNACGGDVGRCQNTSGANAHRSDALTDGFVSNVAFIAGGALIAGGAFLCLTGQTPAEKTTQGIALVPDVASERVGVVLHGIF